MVEKSIFPSIFPLASSSFIVTIPLYFLFERIPSKAKLLMVLPVISMEEILDFVFKVRVFTSKPLPSTLNFPVIKPTALFLVMAAALKSLISKIPLYLGSC